MRRWPRLAEFVAPAPLCAVALMAVNDRWLKPAFHNAWTGKLSDLAICFFLPVYLSALLAVATRWSLRARLACGATATGALFAAIKVSQPAADLFCRALALVGRPLGMTHFRAVADPTDLVALPLIWVAVAYGLHRAPPGVTR